MKRILLMNSGFLVIAFVISFWLQGWDATLRYNMTDFIGYGLILTGQRMLKEKRILAFPVWIIGLIFNAGFGILNHSIVHVLFCIYGIGIMIDNWMRWHREEVK